MLDLSDFASKLTLGSGIGELMQDLGSGLEDARKYGIEISMLGGGNPAIIPEVEQIFEKKFLEIAKDSKRVSRLLGHYESPLGSDEIRELLAESLSSKLD
ncbi:hypothetical protein [Leptospira sp. GIMC2001]|uniref:hypothetical protein n=1 Tax=Leptospira sp. GIMC2001 TaxID=1513297 RepID=UPI0023494914|nr:hypothetical protein [Leptospira sp. GIMC2001]WCL49888.1 hypothetical protein O4O04_03460 [Leptospira sp. GIMC2001]